VRLTSFADRRPAQLSGGQQQRVALARALVNYPSALLLDEPLGALDLKLRQAMQIELKRIQREVGITFIYVTHDQEEALTMSDRIAVMNEGRVDQLGTPQEIYNLPATHFVATFIGVANLLPVTIAAAAGDGRNVSVAGIRCRCPAPGRCSPPAPPRRWWCVPSGSTCRSPRRRVSPGCPGVLTQLDLPGAGAALRGAGRGRDRDHLPSRPGRDAGGLECGRTFWVSWTPKRAACCRRRRPWRHPGGPHA